MPILNKSIRFLPAAPWPPAFPGGVCIYVFVFVYYVLCLAPWPCAFPGGCCARGEAQWGGDSGRTQQKGLQSLFSLLYLSSSFKDSWQLCTTRSKYFCQFRASVCLLSFCDSNIEHECQLFRLKDATKVFESDKLKLVTVAATPSFVKPLLPAWHLLCHFTVWDSYIGLQLGEIWQQWILRVATLSFVGWLGQKKGNDEAKTGFCIFCYISANLKSKTSLKQVFNREETLQSGGWDIGRWLGVKRGTAAVIVW